MTTFSMIMMMIMMNVNVIGKKHSCNFFLYSVDARIDYDTDDGFDSNDNYDSENENDIDDLDHILHLIESTDVLESLQRSLDDPSKSSTTYSNTTEAFIATNPTKHYNDSDDLRYSEHRCYNTNIRWNNPNFIDTPKYPFEMPISIRP